MSPSGRGLSRSLRSSGCCSSTSSATCARRTRRPCANRPSGRRSTSGSRSLFGLLILWFYGAEYGGEYFAGYITEKSLSVDNLFVFVLIMAGFGVPRELQQKVLLFGITFALVLRTVFILVGAAAIENFSWVFYLFGAILIYTAWVAGAQRRARRRRGLPGERRPPVHPQGPADDARSTTPTA